MNFIKFKSLHFEIYNVINTETLDDYLDNVCPLCNSKHLVIDQKTFEVVCVDCGCVVERCCVSDRVLRDKKEDKIIPLYAIRKCRNTYFNPRSVPEKFKKYSKLRTVDKYSNRIEHKELIAFLKKVTPKFPKHVIDDFRKIALWGYDIDIYRGRRIYDIFPAMLSIALWINNVSMYDFEFLKTVDFCGIDKYILAGSRKLVLERLRKSKMYESSSLHPCMDYQKYIERYFSQFNFPQDYTTEFIKRYNNLKKNLILNSPCMAAVIYLVGKRFGRKELTQDNIAKYFCISSATLRSYVRKLKKYTYLF